MQNRNWKLFAISASFAIQMNKNKTESKVKEQLLTWSNIIRKNEVYIYRNFYFYRIRESKIFASSSKISKYKQNLIQEKLCESFLSVFSNFTFLYHKFLCLFYLLLIKITWKSNFIFFKIHSFFSIIYFI